MSNWQKPPLGVQLNTGHPLARGLVGCWLMNEGSGDIAYDLSGNGNTGSLENGASWNGEGISFDGTDDYVSVPHVAGNSLDIIGDQITLAAWIKPAAQNDDHHVITKRSTTQGYSIEFDASTVKVLLYGVTGLISNQLKVAYSFTLNQWYSFIATYNGESLVIYMNNIQVAADGSVHGNINTFPGSLRLGRRSSNTEEFNGVIGSAMVWNVGLNPSQVATLCANPYAMFEPEPMFLFAQSVAAGAEYDRAIEGILPAMTGSVVRTFRPKRAVGGVL